MKLTLLCAPIGMAIILSACCRDHHDQHAAYSSDKHYAGDSTKTAAAQPNTTTPEPPEWQREPKEAAAKAPPAGVSADDRDFAEKAAQGGLLEVESSKLAVQVTASEAVRGFATMMVEDHGGTNRRLESLAKTKSVSLPTSLDAKHQSQLDELRNLTGPEFDARYHALQISAHDDAIELFEKASREGSDPELRAFAAETLPTLRHHRAELDKIQIPR